MRPEHFLPFAERLRRKLMADIPRIQAGQVIARAIVNSNQATKKMGKLAEAAALIKSEKAAADKDGDELLARAIDFAKRRPVAVEVGHKVLDEQHAELASMESDLRQISNLAGGTDGKSKS